jgi:2-amino-4-hydroxy-6-hydroxymethyldihydropteridine diphosphokinase
VARPIDSSVVAAATKTRKPDANRTPTATAIALGSNLGDRRAHLDYAVQRLSGLFDRLQVSRYHETAPVDIIGDQNDFLNAAAIGETTMSARAVLDILLAIEAERGRARPHASAARTLDLDIVLFGDQHIAEPGLVVPHPRFRERRFVLDPLVEIAPNWQDPVSGKTVAELWALLALPPSTT